MFAAQQLVFYYATSPAHMGAGTAVGAIDSPIQREVHTQHPQFAASGIKGAVRHHLHALWGKTDHLLERLFGPETDASEHAGAVAFSDAQLMCLPVRALKGGFVYATCPLALARGKRLAGMAGLPCPWEVPEIPDNQAAVRKELLSQDRLVLEAFTFAPCEAETGRQAIAEWLARHALPPGAENAFFAEKLQKDLVILSDTDFAHFARHGMVVEPHVRIDDVSGTADGGGLFYVENLPPESLLVGLVQASVERYKKEKKPENALEDAGEVLSRVLQGDGTLPGIADRIVQMGGDGSTGRGLILIHPVSREA
ncbi:type III-B CRISPR module RAMP protein Cmr4 [Ectothiorhodospira mobilis]|uniref:type III-B CRISPR module RAMP protein Cmr4 n=1 Tax=Ectothiorhodospira mobilis TaxID=195064 RepID=UPI001EE91D1F|nr:type III-B CRISPR module RAMP protein Cmr4 [Ectothiorhodospira mobilis]MCG5536609.1 type III-B CRISPR module RAMP protein Cmr4 [Ectothiorhodospira mobilis]